jgi:hypothetical protein
MEERDTQVDGTKTPELLVDFITSLDGYGAAEGWPGWWGLQGPEYLAWLSESTGRRLHGPDGCEYLPPHVRVRSRGRAGYGCARRDVEDRLLAHVGGAPDVDEHATHPSRRCYPTVGHEGVVPFQPS